MYFFLYQLIFVLISVATPFFACTNVLLHPLKKREKVILFSYLFILIYFFVGALGQMITPLGMGGVILFVLCVTKQNKMANAGIALFGYLCSVVLNYIFTIALSFFGITMQMIETRFPMRFSIVFFITLYLLTYFIGREVKKRGFLYEMQIPNFVTISLFLDLLICVFIFIFNIIVGEEMGYTSEVIRLNGILFFLFFAVTFVITIVIISNYEKEKKVTQKLKEYENLQDYTEKIEDLYMELRTFKHDYFNIIASLSSYIESQNLEGLRNYFENSILPAGEKLDHKDTVLGALSYMKVEEIKGLVYTKLFHAVQRGVQIELDIMESIERMDMDILDLTRVIGIFLDNAMEAAEKSECKHLYLGFAKREDSVLIVIENSCPNDIIDLSKIYQLGVSTKGKNRGVGLYQVQKIMGKYKNVIHTTGYREGIFTQRVEIMQPKKST
ncbi:MAG: sensor histidine kinase [Velocimicrobium sp.]